jgi:ABC-type glycerol-3-phosphate transport system permease component
MSASIDTARAGRLPLDWRSGYGRYGRPLLRICFTYALLLLASAFIMLPLGWMFTVALKPDYAIFFSNPPQWFPTDEWNWDNFRRALMGANNPFYIYLLNTMWLEIFVVLGTVLSCSIVAFPFARLRFWGSEVLFTVVVLTMLIPWQGLMIPQFLLFYKLGWYGTYLPLIVPSFTANAFFIFLIRQYMRTIPRELDEAARLDGAGTFRIFWSIVLPLSRPALTVCAVLTFLGTWSDLLGPVIYLNDQSQYTISIGLANLVSTHNPNTNLLMAASFITIIPVVVVYFFAQKQLIGGIASMGLKG